MLGSGSLYLFLMYFEKPIMNVANALAKHGLAISVDMRLFDVQLSFISLYLLAESAGICFNSFG